MTMITIQLSEVRSDLDNVIAKAEAGETFLVVRGAIPVAEIRGAPRIPTGKRPSGLAAGEFVVPDDFDAPLPEEILREFEAA